MGCQLSDVSLTNDSFAGSLGCCCDWGYPVEWLRARRSTKLDGGATRNVLKTDDEDGQLSGEDVMMGCGRDECRRLWLLWNRLAEKGRGGVSIVCVWRLRAPHQQRCWAWHWFIPGHCASLRPRRRAASLPLPRRPRRGTSVMSRLVPHRCVFL